VLIRVCKNPEEGKRDFGRFICGEFIQPGHVRGSEDREKAGLVKKNRFRGGSRVLVGRCITRLGRLFSRQRGVQNSTSCSWGGELGRPSRQGEYLIHAKSEFSKDGENDPLNTE